MATSKLEKNIDRIIAYLDSCKPVPFSSGRVMVTKDEIYDMLETMKISLPEEISQYKKIVDNRQRILDDAEQKGQDIIAAATEQANQMIEQDSITQAAYERADQIIADAEAQAEQLLADANADASEIRTGALSYASDMLNEVEKVVTHAFDTSKNTADALVGTLYSNIEVLKSNREEIDKELNASNPQEEEETSPEQGESENPAPEEEEGDYDFDVDTFLDNIEDTDN